MRGKDYVNFILEDRESIKNFIAKISSRMFEYINSKNNSKFVLFYKYLTHSDIATFGKATKVNSHDKNLLYYIKTEEMISIESKTGKPFQTAHQSCIGLKKKFYDLAGLPQPRENDPYLINNYCNVLLCNENMEYFKTGYTRRVFEALNKRVPLSGRSAWDINNLDVELDENSEFTSINLHCAVHGLGMEQDKEFHKLRHHLFKNDTFIILFEKNANRNNMFLLFEKNPAFFSVIGETNQSYVRYQNMIRQRLVNVTLGRDNAISEDENLDEVTRQQQSVWRKMLAQEMMGYTSNDGEVFCPITYITGNFEELGALFVASHIKGFSDPNTTNEEKYDINNGLLLSSSADALFDRHLISIDENKHLVFSFLIDGDARLKQQLLLLQPIFEPILNDKRMAYLKYHYNYFQELEAQRRRA